MPVFTDETIERLFGADDAENERPERFKEYFFYNNAYDSIISALPVRILVGHKGVGKSALLKRAFLKDVEERSPRAWLRPNDILGIKNDANGSADFIQQIEIWKRGIVKAALIHLIEAVYGEDAPTKVPEISDAGTRGLIKVLMRMLDEHTPRSSVSHVMNITLTTLIAGGLRTLPIYETSRLYLTPCGTSAARSNAFGFGSGFEATSIFWSEPQMSQQTKSSVTLFGCVGTTTRYSDWLPRESPHFSTCQWTKIAYRK